MALLALWPMLRLLWAFGLADVLGFVCARWTCVQPAFCHAMCFFLIKNPAAHPGLQSLCLQDMGFSLFD